MSFNYTLKYRTFEQLLDEVRIDFSMYDLENLIQPGQLIKVAKRVNYDLGLRIFQTGEAILELDKGNVKLPDDFYTFNFGFTSAGFWFGDNCTFYLVGHGACFWNF